VRPSVTTTTGALVVLALGGASVSACLVVRDSALERQADLRATAAAYELTEVRADVLAAAANRATARLLEGRGEAPELARPTVDRAWRDTYRSAVAELDRLGPTAAGEDAARLRGTLAELGIDGPAEIGAFLVDHSAVVFDAVLAPPTATGSAEGAAFDDALAPVLTSITYVAFTQQSQAGAEQVLGLAGPTGQPGRLAEHLRTAGFDVPGPGAPAAPAEIVPRTVAAPEGMLPDPDVDLVELGELDPALVARLGAVLRGPDAGAVGTAAGWVGLVLEDDERTPRPMTAVDAAAASVRLTDALVSDVTGTLDERATAASARAADQGRTAALLLLLAVLLGAATLAVIGRTLHQRRHVERLLRAAADMDPLTGLANRRALDGGCATRFAPEDPGTHAVVALDLDGFKPVNDVYGHAVGDEVLRQVSHRLRAAVVEPHVVARTGGDEFVVVLLDLDPATAEAEAGAVAERACAAVSLPCLLGALEVGVGASAGVAVRTDAADLPSVLALADARLYAVKRARPDRGARHGAAAPEGAPRPGVPTQSRPSSEPDVHGAAGGARTGGA